MSKEDSILNDLHTRIKYLEERNFKWKEEIARKKDILNKKRENSSVNTLSIPGENNVMSTISLNQPQELSGPISIVNCELPIEFKQLQQMEENIKKNIQEYTIDYIPFEHINTLYIMGDFTNWELKQMTKNKDLFSYTTFLLKNFKYYYCLSYNDQIIVDMNQFYDKNPKNEQVQNFINLMNDPMQTPNVFDYSIHNNILSLQRKNYLMLKSGNLKEVYFLTEIIKQGESWSKNYNELERERDILLNAANRYYSDELQLALPFPQIKIKGWMQLFKGRILLKQFENPNYLAKYKIVACNESYNVFYCIQLYDGNKIKCNYEYYTSNEDFTIVPLTDVSVQRYDKEDKVFHLLSKEESVKIDNEFENDTTCLIVYYNPNDISSDETNKNSVALWYPKRVEPSSINPDDYIIEAAGSQVFQVKNKNEQWVVKFIAKEEIQEKPVKPTQVQIYYTLSKRLVNVIHIHILDQSLKGKKMSAKYIDAKIAYKGIKQEEEYVTKDEMMLLIRSWKPFRWYYNKHKVQMEAINIINNRIYRITSMSESSAFHDMYVRVANIPQFDLQSGIEKKDVKCKFENIERCDNITLYEQPSINGVDVSFLYDSNKNVVNDSSMQFSFTPCLLKPVDPKEEIELDKQYSSYMKNKSSYEMQKWEWITNEIGKYEIYLHNEEGLKSLTKEKISEILFTMEDYKSSMEIVAKYVESHEWWDNIDKVTILSGTIEEWIMVLNKYW